MGPCLTAPLSEEELESVKIRKLRGLDQQRFARQIICPNLSSLQSSLTLGAMQNLYISLNALFGDWSGGLGLDPSLQHGLFSDFDDLEASCQFRVCRLRNRARITRAPPDTIFWQSGEVFCLSSGLKGAEFG